MAFKRNWGANITRAAIGAHTSWDVVNCYDADSIDAMNKLYRVIDAAIANDMYVIADWHTHKNTLDNAKKFFTAVTEKYGDTPNILYEIWNEPETVKWDEVKAYAEEIIPLIRKKAPNSVIIVGSPTWDQDVDIASESPLKYDNLLYSLHFYAATHKQPLIDKAEKAIANGLPLIISECGVWRQPVTVPSTKNQCRDGLNLPTSISCRCYSGASPTRPRLVQWLHPTHRTTACFGPKNRSNRGARQPRPS